MTDNDSTSQTPDPAAEVTLTKDEEDEIDRKAEKMLKMKSNKEAIKEELKKQKKEEKAKTNQMIKEQLETNAQKLAKSAADAAAITKGFSSKARTELLVDPSEVAFGASFHDALKNDQYLLHNLVDLDWQLNSKFIEWKKAYRHYSVFSTVLTLIIIICTSLVVVFEVMEQSGGIGKDAAAVIVAFLAFVATVMTGWLSYSKAEGKAALLGENQKTVRALQTRVRVLTKHHIPGTISVGNAAIEIDRIKQEQMRVQENVALIYNFQDWGTYSCCFKKCCERKSKKDSESSTDRPSKEARNMKKWFKKMYYDEDYQKVSIEYFKDVLNKKDDDDVCYRGDTSVWTGKQEIGNHKKTTIEDLEKQLELANKKLELAQKIKAAEDKQADIENQNGDTKGVAAAAASASVRH